MVLLTSWPTVTDDTGTKTDGTIFNKALTDAIKAEIERLIHSTVNTTISPEDIIDEVVTARGSKASLDARLDVSMNEDGTMKADAANLSTANYTEGIGSRNVCVNGDLTDWSSGASSAPDDWTLSGAGAAVARTGAGEADTFTFGSGTYAAKVTRAAADSALTQTVISTTDWASNEDVEGGKVAIAANVKTATTSHARVKLNDGFATSSSSYHSGSGSASWLTAVLTIDASATKLEAILEVNNSAGAAYFGGVMVVFAQLAPTRWQPLSREALATATRRGLVGITAQTWAGAKTFSTPPIGIPTFARCTAALTKNNNTTFSDVTGMAFSIGASEVWVFDMTVHFTSGAVPDMKFQLTGPAAPTAVRYGWFGQGGVGTSPVAAPAAAAAFSTSLSVSSAAPDILVIHITGIVRNGANAGTVQLQAAQNTADASDTIILEDSHLQAYRIS